MKKSILYSTIGKNLLKLRKEVGMSQREIAEYLNISRSAYKQYENGTRMIPIPIIDSMSKFYKVSVDDLMGNLNDVQLSEDEKKIVYEYKRRKSYYPTLEGLLRMNDYLRINMKKFRLQHKKTQQQVADYLGIDISTYNKYENGKRKVEVETVKKLAEWYGVKTSDFLPVDN